MFDNKTWLRFCLNISDFWTFMPSYFMPFLFWNVVTQGFIQEEHMPPLEFLGEMNIDQTFACSPP